MVKLTKNGVEMEVGTGLQTSAFLASGWKVSKDPVAKSKDTLKPEVDKKTIPKPEDKKGTVGK